MSRDERELLVVERLHGESWEPIVDFTFKNRGAAEVAVKRHVECVEAILGEASQYRVTRYIPAPESTDEP